MLQQQIVFLQQQLGEANRKVDELLRKVSSLEELLVQKNAEEQKQQNIIKGLSKLQQNKSEKQTPSAATADVPAPESNDEQTAPEPRPREKTNYGARRKEHYEVEVEEEDIYPTDARFDEMKARLIDTHDVVRYILVPMRFIKKVYHVHVYTTETIFENLYEAMGLAVKEDDYLAGDETYHRVLVKMPDGKGSKKGYIWVVTSIHTGLVYYFYHDGSRGQDVILNYIGDYGGTFQSDGFYPYRKMAAQLTRLACLQHVKRKFLDCGDDDEEAQAIVRLINELYQEEHKHKIGEDGWTAEKNLRWRREYAPRILKKIRKKLDQLAADPQMLPKSDRYNAVHYMLNEWDAIKNIFTRGDYNLDNNLVERLNRYISLSRRNSLFFGSHEGAERAAIYYSLACSCRLLGINFFEYISDIINRAAAIQGVKADTLTLRRHQS